MAIYKLFFDRRGGLQPLNPPLDPPLIYRKKYYVTQILRLHTQILRLHSNPHVTILGSRQSESFLDSVFLAVFNLRDHVLSM